MTKPKTTNIFEKNKRTKLYKMLAELKWGKLTYDESIATTCSNSFIGVSPCCSACPSCECHDEIEKYVDKILKL